MARFVEATSGDLQSVLIQPNPLRLYEVDPMLRLVCGRFLWGELEPHQYRNYTILGPALR